MPIEILIFLVCLVMSAFFSGSETALLSAGKLRLRRLAAEGDHAAQRILELVEDPRRLLAGILVGNNVVNVLAAVVAGSYFTMHIEDHTLAAVAATAVATPLLVLFSEFLPKTVAAMHPVRWSRYVASPVRWALWLLWPIIAPLEALTRPLGALLARKRTGLGLAEVRVAVAEGLSTGAVDPTTARVLRGGLSLEWKTVADVLVPRVDVVGVDADAGYAECLRAFREHHFSRLLVQEGTPDADLGYLAAKDLTYLDDEARAGWKARDNVREALRVPKSLPLPQLLVQMRRSGAHYAVVKDEYGGTEGIATLEDVLEELVGEIRDEHDADEMPPVVEVRPRQWLVRGDVTVKELNDRLGVRLLAGEARTLGGYAAEVLGRLPHQGEVVEVADGRLVIVRVEDKRVVQIRFERPPEPPPE